MSETGSHVKKDFFISYNKADRAWAVWIAWHLEEKGHYSIVIQEWDFTPGCNFVVEIDRAIQTCERLVAVLSPDYLASVFTTPEWAAFFARDPTGERRLIVQVRVRECVPEGLLAQIAYLDLVGLPDESAAAALLEKINGKRLKPKIARGIPGGPPRVILSAPRFPGLPDVWNVPHPRNRHFTEPGTSLAELRSALLTEKQTALAGLGGVGKTQLATEYAWRHASDYALVWWIRAEQPATLAADYAALAGELGLPEKDSADQPAAIAAVKKLLLRRVDWLLILDNAGTWDELNLFLPGGQGHVLITSRNPDWSAIASKLPVDKWPTALAVEFLRQRTGQLDDDAAAGEIAREFDGLPLALEQAAAYIGSASKTFASYLALYRQQQPEMHRRGHAAPGYVFTVATTWQLAFERLEREAPPAVALLRLCAFFAPDEIPRDVLVAGAEHLPEPLDEVVENGLGFDDAIAALRRYSLLEVHGDSALSLHRIVQAVVRDGLDSTAYGLWATAAVKIVNAAFPLESGDERTWRDCERLSPHALATAEHASGDGLEKETTAHLVNRTKVYLRGRAELPRARADYESALQRDVAALGPDHRNVALRFHNLGVGQQALGNLPGARDAFQRALEIDEAAFGPKHRNVAIRLHNVGLAQQALGHLPDAREAFERALQIDEAAYESALRSRAVASGPDDRNVAIRFYQLDLGPEILGDLPHAKADFERALEKVEAAHESALRELRSKRRAQIVQRLWDLGGSRSIPDLFQRHRSLQNLRSQAPEFSRLRYNVAIRLHDLGSVLQALGDLPGAKGTFERAIRIALEPDSAGFSPLLQNVAIRLHNLGRVLHALGDLPGAKGAFERAIQIDEALAVKIDEKRLNALLPEMAIDLNNLGLVLKALGDRRGAEFAFERALQIYARAGDHPSTLPVHKNLATLSLTAGS